MQDTSSKKKMIPQLMEMRKMNSSITKKKHTLICLNIETLNLQIRSITLLVYEGD